MAVYKVTVLIFDLKETGKDSAIAALTSCPSQDHSIHPMGIESRTIEFRDDHPLWLFETMETEFRKLFADTGKTE